MSRFLVAVCAVVLVVHVLGGHAHADPLASIPIDHHATGDGHHDSAGGVCDATAVDHAALIADASGADTSFLAIIPSPLAPAFRGVAIERPPRFLLHAALLN